MQLHTHTKGNRQIAEIVADEILISNPDDSLQLLMDLYYQGFDPVIIHEKNIQPEFFDLKTRLAGEVLQKCATYRMHLIIIGDFAKYPAQSLKDFIYESNKGKVVNFLPSVAAALAQVG
ncbi:DUF4180 domain-containing protein [Chitinophaga vietnamensis]|uniref:DUF4180 domain-containing protein n=1 Tax=Chitinophaga vietnamensis TaxID=2593957 RepID=UPI001177B54D|nr:DUF4180 domain-containing protein [Chitinophaga vietnamensis]